MNIEAYWTTIEDMEGVNTKGNYKVRDGDPLVKKSKIESHLD